MSAPIDWEALATEVNANAHAKGFHPRPWNRSVWLINTEIGEAGRAYQNSPAETLWADVSEELCDVAIRALDTAVATGFGFDVDALNAMWTFDRPVPADELPGYLDTTLAAMIVALAQVASLHNSDDVRYGFTQLVSAAGTWHSAAGLDFAAALRSKVDRNAGRPHRHGGKRA